MAAREKKREEGKEKKQRKKRSKKGDKKKEVETKEVVGGQELDQRAVEIVRKATDITGGAKRLDKIEDITLTARHPTYTEVIRYKKPDKMHRESDFPNTHIEVGHDGSRSWHLYEGIVTLDGEGRTPAIEWLFHRIESLLLYELESRVKRLQYLGKKTIYLMEDRDQPPTQRAAFVVRATFDDNWVFTLYFDKAKHTVIKLECWHGDTDKKLERYYINYKRVHKIKLPHRVVEIDQHSKDRTTTKIKYEINSKLTGKDFEVPESPKSIVSNSADSAGKTDKE